MKVSGKIPTSRYVRPRYADPRLVLGRKRTTDTGGIYDGTVGWQDGSKPFDSSEPIHLVKVTLFEGASGQTPPRNDGRAQGHQVLARTAGPLHYVPPDGAQVVVAVPANRMLVPGGPMIIGLPNEARLYADESTFIRIKTETGVISLFTTDDMTPNGKSVQADQLFPGGKPQLAEPQ